MPVDGKERVKEIQKIHEQGKTRIEKSNMPYEAQANKHKRKVVFQPGDHTWIHTRKERFSFQKEKSLRQELMVHLRS